MFITAQSRDSHSTVVTADLIFVNTGLVTKALAAARSRGVEEVCFFSTGSIYRAQRRPFREDDPVDDAPRPYVQSKIAAENIVRDWASRLPHVDLAAFHDLRPGINGASFACTLAVDGAARVQNHLAEGKGLVTNPIHARCGALCYTN